MTTPRMHRNLALDTLKGILIFLVIVGHGLQYIAYAGSEAYWGNPVFKFIYIFHMPLFMAISGYVAARSLVKIDVLPMVLKKAKELLIPVGLWCFAWSVLALVMHKVSFNFGFIMYWAEQTIGNYWFIWSLMFSYLLVKILLVLPFKPSFTLPLSAFLLLFINIPFPSFYLIQYTYPFFCAGFLIAHYHIKMQFDGWSWGILGCLALGIFTLWSPDTYIYVHKLAMHSSQNLANIALMFLGGSVFSVLIYALVCRWQASQGALWLRHSFTRLGAATLPIYLVQQFAFKLVALTLHAPLLPVVWGGILAVMFAVGLTGGIFYGALVMRRWPMLSRLVFGTVLLK